MRRLCLLSCLPMSAILCLAQNSEKKPEIVPVPKGKLPVSTEVQIAKVAPDYKDEALVYESLSRTYTYAADGTGEKRIAAVMRMQSDAAVKQFSITSVPFASSNEKVVIHSIRVKHPDGATVETPAADGMEMPQPVSQQAPFYSDLKMMQVPVRGMRAGDTLEYDVSIMRTNPEAPDQFWGIDSMEKTTVVLKETIELRVPKNKYVQVWSPTLKPETHDEGDQHIYRWSGSQLVPTPKKAATNSSEPQLPQIQWTTFKTWAAVGDWYRGLSTSRAEPNGAVKARADEVVAGLKTDEEKLRAIYKYVSFQIRYVGVSFGVGRYQPHLAGEILLTGYGDCKDKHTLLQAMLKAEGIQAEPALIGAGIKLNDEVPSPGSFNHLITVLPQNGKLLWLDSTSEVAPFGMLISTIRGVKALVVPATGEAALAETPALPPFENIDRFEAEGTLNDKGEMTAHNKLITRGDTEVIIRAVLRQVAPVQMDQVTQYFSSSMGFGGTVSNAKASPVEQTENPLSLEYDYKRDPYGDWPNRKIVPLLPALGLPAVDEENPPKEPIELGSLKTDIAFTKIHLPAGAAAKLPANMHAKSDYITVDKTYAFSNGVITVERTMKVLAKQVPVDEWKKYQAFYKDADEGNESWIFLTGMGGNTAAADSDPAAEPLIQEAGKASDRNDWKKELEILSRVEKVNPRQPYLYSMMGYAQMRQGKLEDAEKSYRRELALHPKEDNVHELLIYTLTVRHNTDAAKKALYAAIGELPNVPSFPLQLQRMLVQEGNTAEAVQVLRSALAQNVDSAALKTELGSLLLKDGKKDEAISLLKPILEARNDSPAVNNAAYALSKAKLELEAAEAAERRILQPVEESTANFDVHSTDVTAAQNSMTMMTYWDTLGWILFKQGKTAEADTYLRAAWYNTQHREIGEHYAELLQAQGKESEGAQVSAMAHSLPDDQRILTEKELRAFKQDTNATQELQKMRTFPLSGTEPKNAYATVQILLGPKGVIDVAHISGDASLSKYYPAIKALDMHLQQPPAELKVQIMRRGILNCTTRACELVLMPMESAVRD